MIVFMNRFLIISSILLTLFALVKMNTNYKLYNSIYDDVDEEDQLADNLLNNFDTDFKVVRNDLWKKFTVSSTSRTCGTPKPVQLITELDEEGFYARANPLLQNIAITCDTPKPVQLIEELDEERYYARANTLLRKMAITCGTPKPDRLKEELDEEGYYARANTVLRNMALTSTSRSLPRKQYRYLSTLKYVGVEVEEENQLICYLNITFWKHFAVEFESCLNMPTTFNQFQLNVLPNDLFRLSNVTCKQRDFFAVTGLLKTFYDVSLWKISKIKSSEQQRSCFHILNKFFCAIQMDNLYQLKLQAVACHRVGLRFQSAYAPQYRIDSHFIKEKYTENLCDHPESGVYIKVDDVTTVHSNIPLDLHFNNNDYFEEGCFEFFVSRMKQRTEFYRENDIAAYSPIISEIDSILIFPDGTAVLFNTTNLLCTIQKYYKCQLLEILAIKNRKSRVCFLRMFYTNMDSFVTECIRRIQNYVMDIDELLAFQSMTRRRNKQMVQADAVKYKPEERFQSTVLDNCSPDFHYRGTSPMSEVELLGAHATQHIESYVPGAEERINLQAIRNHIIQGVCIIIAVAFCLVVFMCFFTIWLCYMSSTARLKQDHEKIELLKNIRSENRTDEEVTITTIT